MKNRAKNHPFAPTFGTTILTRARLASDSARSRSQGFERFLSRRSDNCASAPATNEVPLIYAVDDMPDITELYVLALEAVGCHVRAFSNRVEALVALKADETKPDLLITDYVNDSMPIAAFMGECRLSHPALRVLLVSGFDPGEARLSPVRPDRILGKPFTLQELQQGVRAVLGENYFTNCKARA